MTETNKILVQNLNVQYGSIKAVKNISFQFESAQITTLVGSNGAGKSSTLKALLQLIPAQCDLFFNQQNISTLDTKDRLSLGITLCPEGRGIFPNLSVLDNLMIGGYLIQNGKKIKELLDQQFDFFPKIFERRHQIAGTLSGGEQQMLAIARSLMLEPRFLLLDEPSLGLAPVIIDQIFEKFIQLKNKGIGLLLVEQNAVLALEVSDKAYVMETGEIVLEGTGKELLNDSRVQEAYLT